MPAMEARVFPPSGASHSVSHTAIIILCVGDIVSLLPVIGHYHTPLVVAVNAFYRCCFRKDKRKIMPRKTRPPGPIPGFAAWWQGRFNRVPEIPVRIAWGFRPMCTKWGKKKSPDIVVGAP